ncbi:phospholipase effector Tle1 domain-containing protein [Amphritea balenae]|uniref:phospholipase effector Tle1 domain-containing protein n=1 Tax=Amphritea balenae TaxID=452629 RepID=UPI0014764181|nr:DUF2235 domain-containing protein [Amphritea balenae]
MNGKPGFTRQSGVAAVESLIALPVISLLLMGAVEWARIYEAKTTADHAVTMAARSGAFNNASTSSIYNGLARGLLPYYAPEKGKWANVLQKVSQTLATDSRVRILNPTREAFIDFGYKDAGKTYLPNDALHKQPTTLGNRSAINIQDANLLKVEVTWGLPLRMPVISSLISKFGYYFIPADSFEKQLYARGMLPITSTTALRMQSPAILNDAMLSIKDLQGLQRKKGGPKEQLVADAGSMFPITEQNEGFTGASEYNWLGQLTGGVGGGSGGSEPFEPDPGGETGGGGDTGGGEGGGDPCNYPSGSDSSGAFNSSPVLIGNPINVVSGNKYQREVDIPHLDGELGLVFVRHYNSLSERRGPVGTGWRHSYQYDIIPSQKNYLIKLPDGTELIFEPDSAESGLYHARRLTAGTLKVHRSGFDWRPLDGREFRFTNEALLDSISKGAETLRLSYDSEGQLLRVEDQQGRRLGLLYDAKSRIRAVLDPANKRIEYAYDRGNLIAARYQDESIREYLYEDTYDRHNLTGLIDERGISFASWAYDKQDRAIMTSHANGSGKLNLEYLPDNKTRVTRSDGRITVYQTAVRQRVPLVTGILGEGCGNCKLADLEIDYSTGFQQSVRRYSNGNRLQYEYDRQGRKISEMLYRANNQLLSKTTYRYAGNGADPVQIIAPSINSAGQLITDIRYNAESQPVSYTQQGFTPLPEGGFQSISRTTHLIYKDQRLIALDGPRDDVDDRIQLYYDTKGRLNRFVGLDGIDRKVLAFDSWGRAVKVQTGQQAPVLYSYDNRGRLLKVMQGGHQISYTYDAAGNRTQVNGLNRSSQWRYNEAGEVSAKIGTAGQRQEIDHDSLGRITQQRSFNPAGELIKLVNMVYDSEGRLNALTDKHQKPLVQYSYDQSGQLQQLKSRHKPDTLFFYDARGQVNGIEHNHQRTGFVYDNRQQLTQVIDARGNLNHQLTDDFGRIVARLNSDSGEQRYRYDAAGNLTALLNSEQQLQQYQYDAANRLIRLETPEGITRLNYDAVTGKLAAIDAPDEQHRYRYNREGQIISNRQSYGEQQWHTRYRYDELGRLVAKQLTDGQTLEYRYWQQGPQKGDLKQIIRSGMVWDDSLAQFKQHETLKGAVSTTRYLNDEQRVLSFDRKNQLLQQQDGPDLRQYQYDFRGRLLQQDKNGQLSRYHYGLDGRMIAAKTPMGRYLYAYDSAGNRTLKQHRSQKQISLQRFSYSPAGQGNRLQLESHIRIAAAQLKGSPVTEQQRVIKELVIHSQPEQQRYSYTRTGAVMALGDKVYRYDSNQRPVELYKQTDAGLQLIARYRYNYYGERIAKTVYNDQGESQQFRYLYENGRLVAEQNNAGNIRRYIYLEGKPSLMMKESEIYSLHTDHQGAVSSVSDQWGKTVWRAEYAPFGEAYINNDADADGESLELNLRLAGQYFDAESGLHYNYMRDYNPRTGRYLSADPMGLLAGINRYAYVRSNPVNASDPLGLLLFAFDGTGNSDPAQPGATISNVVKFRDSYVADPGEVPNDDGNNWFYITGVGTDDPTSGINGGTYDAATGSTLGERVAFMTGSLVGYIEGLEEKQKASGFLDIDIVGFSRGAASARVFANVVQDIIDGATELTFTNYVDGTDNDTFTPEMKASLENVQRIMRGELSYRDQINYCPIPLRLNIRFMGLWDTVPHYGGKQGNDLTDLALAVPDAIGHTAHAVAVNEDRDAFEGVSIHQTPTTQNSGNRVELGFVGAHSDIGGGYAEGDLSDVALMWMIDQASSAGVGVDRDYLASQGWDEVTSPIVHDSVSTLFWRDREFKYLDGTSVDQVDEWQGPSGSITYQESLSMFDLSLMEAMCIDEFTPEDCQSNLLRRGLDSNGDRTLVGELITESAGYRELYQKWLAENYGLDIKISGGSVSTAGSNNTSKVIDSNSDALDHYFEGNGESVELGPQAKQALLNHQLVLRQSEALKSGTAKHLNDNLSVELREDIYHIGKTRVDFSTVCKSGSCTTTYVGFANDGFWDPLAPAGFGDGIGGNWEALGGTGYYYLPYIWSETYKDNF